MTEGIELSNQDKIQKLSKKETYLWILEADTRNHAKIKSK